jgi:hypothetical protein
MKITKSILITFSMLTMLQGCSTNYYGHSKEEWDNFSREEQIAIEKEYQSIIGTANAQKHKDIIDARKQSIIDLGTTGRKY